ncbi:MAG: hypothetical protein COT74_12135 [Bdellovibrionales bacterium CG10_big_fil_rev_8_21_14_0_10_45_34]|nr:MAG: hypothetical protein COT74_12135 [Bdellovibrionales bacterium CG10_big_fil_rev_8_21_14_0_10_45_34]
MKTIGIDIGQSRVKVSVIEGTNRQFRILNYVEYDVYSDEADDNHKKTVEALRRIQEEFIDGQLKVIVGLPQSSVISRHKVFPFRERIKIARSLPFELEDEIPLDQDEAQFEFKTIQTTRSAAEVLAFVAPDQAIAQTLNVLESAFVDPDVLSVESAAVSNLFENWSEPPPEVERLDILDENESELLTAEGPTEDGAVLIDLGHSKSVLSVYRRGRLLAQRTIDFGGATLIGALCNAYSLSSEQARTILEEKAFLLITKDKANEDQIRFAETLAQPFDEFAKRAKMSILELETQFQFKATRVSLIGGLSQVLNVGPYLTQRLEVATNVQALETPFANSAVTFDKPTMAKAAVSLSFAIEGLKRPRNPAIDFRKGAFVKKSLSMQLMCENWSPIFYAAVAIFFIASIYSVSREMMAESLSDASYQAMLDQARSPAVGLKGSAASAAGVSKFLRTKKKEIRDRELMEKLTKMNSSLDVLKEISNKMPARSAGRIDVREVQIASNQVTVFGLASQANLVSQIENTLKAMSLNGKVETMPTQIKPAAGQLAFGYKFEVDRIEN